MARLRLLVLAGFVVSLAVFATVRAEEAKSDNPAARAVDRRAHTRLVRAFVAAAHDGDFTELEAVLAADIRTTHSTSLPALETSCE